MSFRSPFVRVYVLVGFSLNNAIPWDDGVDYIRLKVRDGFFVLIRRSLLQDLADRKLQIGATYGAYSHLSYPMYAPYARKSLVNHATDGKLISVVDLYMAVANEYKKDAGWICEITAYIGGSGRFQGYL